MLRDLILGVVFFAILYGIAVFGWTSWKLHQWRRIVEDPEWSVAIARGDHTTADAFFARGEQMCAEYDSFCRRFAPFLLT